MCCPETIRTMYIPFSIEQFTVEDDTVNFRIKAPVMETISTVALSGILCRVIDPYPAETVGFDSGSEISEREVKRSFCSSV